MTTNTKLRKLLSIDTNAKTVKGQKYGVLTGILYLAPYTNSGYGNVCPAAKQAGCEKACLYSAGRGAFTNVQSARIEKTRMYHEEYERFMNSLLVDIQRLVDKAHKQGVIPMVRLNGTSDILWERKSFTVNEEARAYFKRKGIEVADTYDNLMSAFPNVQFYDYTKLAGRFNYNMPSNYDLTFSYSGVETYKLQVRTALKAGARIAVVFRDAQPTEFMGMRVVDGDDSDIRPFDPQGVVVALTAKGQAKSDTSGFVVDAV